MKINKNVLYPLAKQIGSSSHIAYYPVLRYTGLGLKKNLILSYVIGWNESKKPCFLNKDVVSENLGFDSSEEADMIIHELLYDKILKTVKTQFKNKIVTSYEVDVDMVERMILSNERYALKIKFNKMKEEIEKQNN